MKALITILILLTSFEIVSAQVTQEWIARYNGPGNLSDNADAIAVDGSGNVYVTGASTGSGTGTDYATIKYNSSGVQQWAARYNGPGNLSDLPNSIAIDGSGNVYVTGLSDGSATNYDFATIKYNSSGNQQWAARYNDPGNLSDIANSIAIDGSGNVYVTGFSEGNGIISDYSTIKYNSAGVQQWAARYNGPGNLWDYANSIAVDGSGNVYVTGSSYGNGTLEDYATIKYNSAGVTVWVKRYNGPGNYYDGANSIAVDGSGNIYVTGFSQGNGTGSDYATIKYNSSGDSVWLKRYNGPENSSDGANSIAVDSSGNVYVTGFSFVSEPNCDYATIKYNSSGVQQWAARYNGPGNVYDVPNSIVIDSSGNAYVTGFSQGNGTDRDYATIKYNSSGVQQWATRYNGPGNSSDYASSIAVDSSGNVYVTGYSYGNGTDNDFATIKYSQTIGINQISISIPYKCSLSQNYPNPFNPSTNIEFSLPEKSFVKLKVFDITGKEVAELVNENLSVGTFRYDFNAGELSSGLYFYKLETEKFTETKKMIVLK